MVQHGLIQLALKTATDAPFQIRPSCSHAGGFIVWRTRPGGSPTSMALFNNRDDAEDYVSLKIAVLGEFV